MRNAGGWLVDLVSEVPLEARRVRHHVLHDTLLEDSVLPAGHHDVPDSDVPCLGRGRSICSIPALGLDDSMSTSSVPQRVGACLVSWGREGRFTYETAWTGCVVGVDPVGAVVCVEVLAPVRVETTACAHGDCL